MRLKELRKKEHLTQTEFANKLNIPPTTYAGHEKGDNEPSLKLLIKYANFYNVSLDYLVGRLYNNEIGFLTDKQKNIAKNIKYLNDYELEKINAIIQGILITKNINTDEQKWNI